MRGYQFRAASSAAKSGVMTPHLSSDALCSALYRWDFIVSKVSMISVPLSLTCWNPSMPMDSINVSTTPNMNSVLAMFFATTWCDICTTAFVSPNARLQMEELPHMKTRSQGMSTLSNETIVSPSSNCTLNG